MMNSKVLSKTSSRTKMPVTTKGCSRVVTWAWIHSATRKPPLLLLVQMQQNLANPGFRLLNRDRVLGEVLVKGRHMFLHLFHNLVWLIKFVILRPSTIWILSLLIFMGRHIPILLPSFQLRYWSLHSQSRSFQPSTLFPPLLLTWFG